MRGIAAFAEATTISAQATTNATAAATGRVSLHSEITTLSSQSFPSC